MSLYGLLVEVRKLDPNNKKGAIMSRTFADLTRFIGNYRHYRRKGLDYKSAWYLASLTLP